MDIEIGSNVYRNSNGVIEMEGVPLVQLAVKPSSGALLVNFALFDQAGRMVARILRGEAPGTIPVEFATGGQLFVNPGAAARMGITIPQAVIDRANTVVQ